MPVSSERSPPPSEIIIIGAGVFGLSTALSLLSRPAYSKSHITILDASPTLPNPSGSSVDASRIVRADYACKPYAELAVAAQTLWRDKRDDGWGGQGRYLEPGFVITTDDEGGAAYEGGGGYTYVNSALENVRSLAKQGVQGIELEKIEVLDGEDAIRQATGYEGVSGRWGYANWNSGWADAEASVAHALRKVKEEGGERVSLRSGCLIRRLLLESGRCLGVELENGEKVMADLTVLAAGAWSPSLIDLEGQCLATGQTLTYIEISAEEQKAFEGRPTIMNMSRGIFIIPPQGRELKVARHGYGYRNMQPVSTKDGVRSVSVPKVDLPVPIEGQDACREALKQLLPQMGDRPFSKTRICWPDGDFLIDYHPKHGGLFLATGGSGHGFKFFPVIGEKIVDAIEAKLDPALKELWRWKEGPTKDFVGCDDGSRAGRKGMLLDEEIKRQQT